MGIKRGCRATVAVDMMVDVKMLVTVTIAVGVGSLQGPARCLASHVHDEVELDD